MDIYGLDSRFSFDLRLRLLGLLLLILSAVILIMFWSQLSGNFAVEGGKLGFEGVKFNREVRQILIEKCTVS